MPQVRSRCKRGSIAQIMSRWRRHKKNLPPAGHARRRQPAGVALPKHLANGIVTPVTPVRSIPVMPPRLRLSNL